MISYQTEAVTDVADNLVFKNNFEAFPVQLRVQLMPAVQVFIVEGALISARCSLFGLCSIVKGK